ncbi:uncharacterized protein LOC112342787 isoform X2 [Selaginella moellendorffii]|uniref:uncharacterized protein LOC112342787 isoform X2 n=1 Tax=Selaginella moellendorffii TaxID=88036 RepID=UPI000D1CB3C8|nr:uncharacterized protein LOC112342787 isoform X2 [Selaginella moellendorffii]|eukprot:XP_024520907.1 uncharacterized protein LOC112342787 isoform X2 [Selaginella moellendorffii]
MLSYREILLALARLAQVYGLVELKHYERSCATLKMRFELFPWGLIGSKSLYATRTQDLLGLDGTQLQHARELSEFRASKRV